MRIAWSREAAITEFCKIIVVFQGMPSAHRSPPPSINALKLVMQSAKDIGMSYLGNPRKYDLVPKGHFIGSEQDADRKDHLSTVPPGSPFPKRRGDAHFFRSASAAPRLVQLPANLPNSSSVPRARQCCSRSKDHAGMQCGLRNLRCSDSISGDLFPCLYAILAMPLYQ